MLLWMHLNSKWSLNCKSSFKIGELSSDRIIFLYSNLARHTIPNLHFLSKISNFGRKKSIRINIQVYLPILALKIQICPKIIQMTELNFQTKIRLRIVCRRRISSCGLFMRFFLLLKSCFLKYKKAIQFVDLLWLKKISFEEQFIFLR